MKRIIISLILTVGLCELAYAFDLRGTITRMTNTVYVYVTNNTIASVQKSAQTNSYATGDDGDLQKGVAFPSPRFTVQTNTNCVLDNLTGLIWARNANQFGSTNWSAALSDCNNLDYGGKTDWRLPNLKEILSLFDLGEVAPVLPTGHPFANVQSTYYWTSTTAAVFTNNVWWANMYAGQVANDLVTNVYYVWPVRGP